MSTVNVGVSLKLQGTSEIDKLASKVEAANRRMEQAGLRSSRNQGVAYNRMTQDRERVGIRSEQRIQREIAVTQAAYQRLAQSGRLSMSEQARAAEAARKKVRELTNEMGKLTAAQKALSLGKGLAAAGAGVVAAGAVLKAPLERAMSYEERMAGMANTAYAGQSLERRKAGMQQLDAAVVQAYREGGGTREGAAGALDTMVASGVIDVQNAIKTLPQIMKAATASGANPEEVAAIAIRAQQNMKIDPSRMSNVLNMALAAGQAGGFELKDMAKWLPQQMAAASMSGLTGEAGFAKLAALNQVAVTTAGTKDEAGNNVVNLLAKINSADTAKDAKKNAGIDLPKYLADQRAKGVDSVDAFAALVRGQMAGNKDYQALQSKLATTGKDDPARQQMLESMAQIAQGTAIGSLIQDRQAMMPLIALMNDPSYMASVLGKVNAGNVGAGGAVDQNFELMSGLNSFKVRMAGQDKDAAMQAAYGETGGAVGGVAEAFSSLAQSAPLLTGATIAATTALTAFAATAGLASFAMGGRGGAGILGRGAGLLSTVAGAAGGRGMAGIAAKGVGLLKGGGAFGLAASVAGAGISAVAGDATWGKYASAGLSGAGLGATIGSIVPGIGTAVGAAVGGLGGVIVQGVSDALSRNKQAAKPESAKMDAVVKVDMSPDLRATLAQVKAQGAVSASISAGGTGAIANRGRVFGGL